MRELRDRVAVVTGAASGIGRALAERFAAEGMRVALADVEEPALEAVRKELEGRGARVVAVPTDVSRAEAVDALARRTLEAFGAVHVVCNNAGVSGGLAATWERSLAEWQWVLGVNLWGVIHGIRSFVPILLEQGEGHVVNTASVAGLVTFPGASDYTVSKHGVVALTETLHHELEARDSRVRASVLCPAWVNTRILEADRNRPHELRDVEPVVSDAEREEVEGMVRDLLANSLAPERVADAVLEAIREERFYVLTHPDWKPRMQERFDAILGERDPSLTQVL